MTEVSLASKAYDDFFSDKTNIEGALREFRLKKSLQETSEYAQVKKLIVSDLMNIWASNDEIDPAGFSELIKQKLMPFANIQGELIQDGEFDAS